MKTPGPYLRENREKRGLTIEKISSDTNISVRYIVAIEEEKFSEFPGGELYLLGFLKTYAEYLGIRKDEILNIYRNYQISESPVPVHELLGMREKIPYLLYWASTLVIVLVIGIGLSVFLIRDFYISSPMAREDEIKNNPLSENSRKSQIYLVTEDKDYKGTLELGDYIKVMVENKEYFFTPVQIRGEEVDFLYSDRHTLESGSEFSVQFGEKKKYLLGNNQDLQVLLKVTDLSLSSQRLVSVEIKRIVDLNEESDLVTKEEESDKKRIGTLVSFDTLDQIQKRRVIITMRSPVRVDVNIVFAGNTNFRYLLDNRESHERYYQEGEKLQRNMTKNFKLWTSNAGKTRLKVGLKEVHLGRDGEVAVKTFHWFYNRSTGLYELVLDENN